MSYTETHSLLFRNIITKLNDVYGADGDRIDGQDEENFKFFICYERRPVERFAHNYERDKFLHSRDKYVILKHNQRCYIVTKLVDREHTTMYTKPLGLIFPQEGRRHAEKTLERLLHKFYSSVRVEEISDVREADMTSSGHHGNNIRIAYEI